MKRVSIQEYQKLDLRVGTIIDAEVPKWSHYVMKLTVDVGPIEGDPSTRSARSGQSVTRTVFAGIMNFFKAKDLIGKQSLFIVNLEPKKIGPEGDHSEGMMLMAVPSPGATAGKATPTHEASTFAKATADKSVGNAVPKDDETTPPVFLMPKKKVPNGTKIM